MSYDVSNAKFDELLAGWKVNYRVYAPRLLAQKTGGRQVVRYQEINSVNDIYNERNTDFSAKEVYYPISQTMLYFTENEVVESQLKDDRGIILFLHPCDINALRRSDNIFLGNGGNADVYYERLRSKVRIVLLECKQSADNCFCVSMNSNVATDYDLAVRLGEGSVKLQVKNGDFVGDLTGVPEVDFEPEFVQENSRKVKTPTINGVEELKVASALEYWGQFDEECIGCGGCNTVCPTCTCFDTVDIIYDETSRDGERRRVWSSCMLDTFTMTAGGARARKTAGANMRFKALHKVYDYQKRFETGENMCVGCGRCILRCPKKIDFSATLNGFTEALDEAKGGK